MLQICGYFPQNPHTAYKKDASPETIINRARATVSQEFGVKTISPLVGESVLLLDNPIVIEATEKR